jgi:hypothetical protein
MCKKFIIETYENSSFFAILYIYFHNGRDRGFMKFYAVYGEAELHEVTDFEKGSGQLEISEKLIEIAEKKCEENGAVLWSY